jgi:hypothetical protein
MIQRSYGVRFVLEAFGEPFVSNFDRDNLVQPGIPSLVDFAHSTRA